MKKIVYKGKFIDNRQLPIVDTTNATVYEEPEDIGDINGNAIKFVLPITIIASLIGLFTNNGLSLWGLVLFILSMPIHELLHCLIYPKNSKIEMFRSNFCMFVTSVDEMSKARFILMNMFPNIFLGVLPIVISILFQNNTLFTFGFLSLISGISDYDNIYKTVKQVPDGTNVFNSGIHSYWRS